MWGKSKKKLEKNGEPSLSDKRMADAGLSPCFEYIRWLGSGGSGDTHLMKDKQTQQLVAIKLIQRPIPKAIVPEHIFREIKIQAQLGEGCVNIINAKEAILTEKHLAIVLEYAAGGSMTAYVSSRWHQATHSGMFLSEDEARYLFRQFLNAVEYCHKHKVAHRDLKLDNSLLTEDNPPRLMLCDFGFARAWSQDAETNMYTHIGTPVYMSPELIESRNGIKGYDAKKTDVWACGVLLTSMLLGTFPYDHTKHPNPNSEAAQLEVWAQQIYKTWKDAPQVRNLVKRLSLEVVDLLDKIFEIDATKRFTVEEVKNHPWYNKPLSERHAKAERAILEEQANIEANSHASQIDQELLKARDQQLLQMVEQARVRAERSWTSRKKPLLRINLSDQSVIRLGTIELPTESLPSESSETLTQGGPPCLRHSLHSECNNAVQAFHESRDKEVSLQLKREIKRIGQQIARPFTVGIV